MAKQSVFVSRAEILQRCDLKVSRTLFWLGAGIVQAIAIIGTGLITGIMEATLPHISKSLYTLIIFSWFSWLMSLGFLNWAAHNIRLLPEEDFGNAEKWLWNIRVGEVFEDVTFIYQVLIALLFILTIWGHEGAMYLSTQDCFPYLFWLAVILIPIFCYCSSPPYALAKGTVTPGGFAPGGASGARALGSKADS